jgi:hypothetical protein
MGNFIFFINFLQIEIYIIISYIFDFVNCFIQQLLARISYNVPAVYDVFASPDKGLRSKTRAGKMWVEGGVGRRPQAD